MLPPKDICERFYKYGDSEFSWLFPLSRIVRPSPSGDVQGESGEPVAALSMEKHVGALLPPGIRRTLSTTASLVLGTTDVFQRVNLSNEFEQWIADFRPEVVLSFFSTLNTMRMVELVLSTFSLPNVALINDDWVSTIYRRGLLSVWLRPTAQRALTRILVNATAAIGVSPAMCDAYSERYRRPFHWFSGPVEVEALLSHAKTKWTRATPFRMLYAGRVGRANQNSLIDACEAVSALRHSGEDVVFDLYLTANADVIRTAYRQEHGIVVHPPIPYEDAPRTYAEADLLFLPIDFDDDSRSFAKYSMSTKIAEYCATGAPILVYAPPDVAMCSYAQTDNWALVVWRRSVSELKAALSKLIHNEGLRETLGQQAIRIAKRDHDAAIVRDRFRRILSQSARARA
jgi:glycosyltransferase involved in cell wall biosynthesis